MSHIVWKQRFHDIKYWWDNVRRKVHFLSILPNVDLKIINKFFYFGLILAKKIIMTSLNFELEYTTYHWSSFSLYKKVLVLSHVRTNQIKSSPCWEEWFISFRVTKVFLFANLKRVSCGCLSILSRHFIPIISCLDKIHVNITPQIFCNF